MRKERNVHQRDRGQHGAVLMEPIIRAVVERIIEQVHPLRIILFGSVARDEQGLQSDVDLLVVMPAGAHKRQTAQMLYRKLRGLPVPVDILVTTEVDLDRQKDNPGLIYRTILQEGRELYAVMGRYPGDAEPITESEYERAIRVAEAVLVWAKQIVG